MELIDSSDSDATVSYASQSPNTPQDPVGMNDVEQVEPMEGDTVSVPVQMVQITTQTQTQDVIRKPPNSKGKKRKNRISSDTELSVSPDDESVTCPICLDHWNSIGDHRLVSLKCGHLFGESCIRRWLRECPPGNKVCPQCKGKAIPSHIRHLYARRLIVVDNSEAVRLQKDLDEERRKATSLQMDLQVLRMQYKQQQDQIVQLEQKVTYAQLVGSTSAQIFKRLGMYKLFMEKNVEICSVTGCRVLLFGKNRRYLVASQKATTTIFPGHGARFLDLPTFRPNHYIYVSANAIRDMAFDQEEDLLVTASSEKTCKLFNTMTRSSVEQFQPSDVSNIWSCAFDQNRTKILYLGSQNGSVYSYDIRQPRVWVAQHKTPGDLAPVVKICPVPPNENLPFGGFLVCKLISCWFFEYTNTEEIISTKLNIDGPFTSMSYDAQTQHVLLSTRPSSNHPTTRHILADIIKLNESMCSLQPLHTFLGSKVQSQISRNAQVNLRDNIVVSAYLEDTKVLQTWETRNGSRMQAIPAADKIFDTCPIYLDNDVHLAALTENKCRIYKFLDDA